MKLDYSRYIVSLIITIAIFSTAFYMSNYFSDKKINNIKSIQESIAVDILSNETQFLLKEVSCSSESFNATAGQLNELGEKVTYTENQLGSTDGSVIYLKKYYSLLEIKDYLLSKRVAEKCSVTQQPIFMIYMYTNNTSACSDCSKQAAILARLRDIYPDLRIYTFDYDLELAPIDTLKKIYKIENNKESTFPILVIEDKPYYGLKSIEDLKKLLPDRLKEATSTDTVINAKATTTIKK